MGITPTTRHSLSKQAASDAAWYVAVNATFDYVDDRLNWNYNGNPNGHVIGNFIGQLVYDYANNLIYICTTAGNAGAAVWRDLTTIPAYPTLSSLGAAALAGGNAFTGQQSGGVTALTSASNSIAINMGLNNNFSHTFTENTTLANPSNAVAGTGGQISFLQHASSAKTFAVGANWHEVNGDTAAVSTTVGSTNLLSYYCVSSTYIAYTISKFGVT